MLQAVLKPTFNKLRKDGKDSIDIFSVLFRINVHLFGSVLVLIHKEMKCSIAIVKYTFYKSYTVWDGKWYLHLTIGGIFCLQDIVKSHFHTHTTCTSHSSLFFWTVLNGYFRQTVMFSKKVFEVLKMNRSRFCYSWVNRFCEILNSNGNAL